MKKKITFYELLTMMKNGKAPKKVCFNSHEWVLRGNESRQDYYYAEKTLSACSGELMYMGEFVGHECISYEEIILTDKEKAYLSAVLKPYKDRVKKIVLYGSLLDGYEYLTVCITSKTKDCVDSMQFPYFEKGTMYSGMKVNQAYTPSELGLWEEE